MLFFFSFIGVWKGCGEQRTVTGWATGEERDGERPVLVRSL